MNAHQRRKARRADPLERLMRMARARRPIFMGIDMGRPGSDRTVWWTWGRQPGKATLIERIAAMDPDLMEQQAAWVREQLELDRPALEAAARRSPSLMLQRLARVRRQP